MSHELESSCLQAEEHVNSSDPRRSDYPLLMMLGDFRVRKYRC
jgi:hypothetical protein